MAETRKPEFIFQANRKNPEKGGKPLHLSTFELFPASLWKGTPSVSRLYGEYTPLSGLYRLKVDSKWYKFHPDYKFLTFHEVWRVIGSLTSNELKAPVDWNNDIHHFKRGDQVRKMGENGLVKKVILKSHIDEIGIEWVIVHGEDDYILANSLLPLIEFDEENTMPFEQALCSTFKGMALWYWSARSTSEPETWEIISCELAAQRGLDPKVSTIHALQMGGMSLHAAEEYFAKNIA